MALYVSHVCVLWLMHSHVGAPTLVPPLVRYGMVVLIAVEAGVLLARSSRRHHLRAQFHNCRPCPRRFPAGGSDVRRNPRPVVCGRGGRLGAFGGGAIVMIGFYLLSLSLLLGASWTRCSCNRRGQSEQQLELFPAAAAR